MRRYITQETIFFVNEISDVIIIITFLFQKNESHHNGLEQRKKRGGRKRLEVQTLKDPTKKSNK
jgi:hypothetical protein